MEGLCFDRTFWALVMERVTRLHGEALGSFACRVVSDLLCVGHSYVYENVACLAASLSIPCLLPCLVVSALLCLVAISEDSHSTLVDLNSLI